MAEMGFSPKRLAANIVCVTAQRLMKRVCDHCSTEMEPTPDEVKILSELGRTDIKKLRMGKGCKNCGNTGYFGHSGVFELLVMSENMRKLVENGVDVRQIERQAKSEGVKPLGLYSYLKALSGATTIEEAARLFPDALKNNTGDMTGISSGVIKTLPKRKTEFASSTVQSVEMSPVPKTLLLVDFRTEGQPESNDPEPAGQGKEKSFSSGAPPKGGTLSFYQGEDLSNVIERSTPMHFDHSTEFSKQIVESAENQILGRPLSRAGDSQTGASFAAGGDESVDEIGDNDAYDDEMPLPEMDDDQDGDPPIARGGVNYGDSVDSADGGFDVPEMPSDNDDGSPAIRYGMGDEDPVDPDAATMAIPVESFQFEALNDGASEPEAEEENSPDFEGETPRFTQGTGDEEGAGPENEPEEKEVSGDYPSLISDHEHSEPLRILLFYRDILARKALRKSLEECEGWEVQAARIWSEGSHLAKKWMPDVVILDLDQPDEDGIQIVNEVRQNPDYDSMLIMAAAEDVVEDPEKAEEDEERELAAWRAGIDDYMRKPFSAELLIARINAHRRLLRKRN